MLSNKDPQFGPKLKEARLAVGLSLAEFGKRVGVSANTILDYERMYQRRTPERLYRPSDIRTALINKVLLQAQGHEVVDPAPDLTATLTDQQLVKLLQDRGWAVTLTLPPPKL